jgi:hypothetical protein
MGDTSGRQSKQADLEEGDVSAAGLADVDDEEDLQHDEDEDEDLMMLVRPEVRFILVTTFLSSGNSGLCCKGKSRISASLECLH